MNKYHDKDGQFTEKENAVSPKNDTDDNLEDFDYDADDVDDEDYDVSDDDDDEFEDFDDDDPVFDVEDIEDEVADLSQEDLNWVDELGFGEAEEHLLNDKTSSFDTAKVISATEEELKELLKAVKLLEKEKELIDNNEELQQYNELLFENLWVQDVSAADWPKKKDKFYAKLDYFENSYSGPDKQKKINDLLNFKKYGELYEEKLKTFSSGFEEARKLVESFQDPNALYSQKRKDNAVWIKGSGAVSQSIKLFGPKGDQVLNNLLKTNPEAHQAVVFYTGSYSCINEPLREVNYHGGKVKSDSFIGSDKNEKNGLGFVKTVEKMTEAIDQSTYDFDYWLQRGTYGLDISKDLTLTSATDIDTLKNLVGTTFKHQSFYSGGAAKGTGFSHYPIIINTYCPKGTKGLYMNTQGHFSGSSENEIILQRGYSFKITKVEKHNGKIYLDVDCILGSDSEKWNSEQLEELKKKHLKI